MMTMVNGIINYDDGVGSVQAKSEIQMMVILQSTDGTIAMM